MPTSRERISELVRTFEKTAPSKGGDVVLAAVQELHRFAGDPAEKGAVREAGGVEALVDLLRDSEEDTPTQVLAIEALSFLLTDDIAARAVLRECGGVAALVGALGRGARAEATHRALLAVRVLSDRDAEREVILAAGGVPRLTALLDSGPDSEVTQCALAALGNLAAGSQTLKDAIREAGALPALVGLLRSEVEAVAAELAAVALRNLSLGNSANRTALVQINGLAPLLRLLSEGQDRLLYPMRCQVAYSMAKLDGSSQASPPQPANCCLDPEHAHVCIAPMRRAGLLACVAPHHGSPRDRNAERYSLLRKLTIVEEEPEILRINFIASDKEGAPRIQDPEQRLSKRALAKRLDSVVITSYSAVEYKGLIMRMLTRMHLEREFNIHRDSRSSW